MKYMVDFIFNCWAVKLKLGEICDINEVGVRGREIKRTGKIESA